MEKVLKLINEKKVHLERVVYKAELIPDKSDTIVWMINDYKDELSQLTKAEFILKSANESNHKYVAHFANTDVRRSVE